MKKVIALFILSSVLMSGCLKQSDGKFFTMTESCIKGVVYYNSPSKFAPALKQDGKPYTCSLTKS